MLKRFRKRSLFEQIRYFYILLFLGVFLLCGGFYFITARSLIASSEDSILEYGLQMTETNMEALLNNINDSSRMIAFNDVVQEMLRTGVSPEYEERVRLQDTVIRMAASCDGISSIFVFNTEGEAYTAGNVYEVEAIRSKLESSSFYQAMQEESETTGTETTVFTYPTYLDEERQMISFLRQIRDLDTLEKLGILAINIPVSSIKETFAQVAEQYDMEIAVIDDEGKTITSTDGGEELTSLVSEAKLESGKDFYQSVSFQEKNAKPECSPVRTEPGALWE